MPDSPKPADFGFPASPGDQWPAIMGDPGEEFGPEGGVSVINNRSEFARSRYPTLPRWYGAGGTAWWGGTSQYFNKTSYAANRLYAWPFPSHEGGLIYQVGIANSVAWAAGENCRIGIYAATSLWNIYPGRHVFDTEIAVGATTGQHTQIINRSIEPQQVYWAVICFNATTVGTILTDFMGGATPKGNLGTVDPVGSVLNQGYGIYVDFTYGAMPLTFPGGGTVSEAVPMNGAPPYMMFKE